MFGVLLRRASPDGGRLGYDAIVHCEPGDIRVVALPRVVNGPVGISDRPVPRSGLVPRSFTRLAAGSAGPALAAGPRCRRPALPRPALVLTWARADAAGPRDSDGLVPRDLEPEGHGVVLVAVLVVVVEPRSERCRLTRRQVEAQSTTVTAEPDPRAPCAR